MDSKWRHPRSWWWGSAKQQEARHGELLGQPDEQQQEEPSLQERGPYIGVERGSADSADGASLLAQRAMSRQSSQVSEIRTDASIKSKPWASELIGSHDDVTAARRKSLLQWQGKLKAGLGRLVGRNASEEERRQGGGPRVKEGEDFSML